MRDTGKLLAAFGAIERSVRENPPINEIRASHAVPFSRAIRQWDTKGRLIVWVNRGQLHDALPLLPSPDRPSLRKTADLFSPAFGIPVIFDA